MYQFILTCPDLVRIGALPNLMFSLMEIMVGAPRSMVWFPAIFHAAESVKVRSCLVFVNYCQNNRFSDIGAASMQCHDFLR